MAEQDIDYESLTQDALRGVVRSVLARVSQAERLPGKHHFYISFDTRAEGVSISKRLRDQYPEEMTIVLQHRYWDLHVHDDRFEVKLAFNSIPERLIVPFKALKVFFDPSVQFGLPFERPDSATTRLLPAAPPVAVASSAGADTGPPLQDTAMTSPRVRRDDAEGPAAKPKVPTTAKPAGRKEPKVPPPPATTDDESDDKPASAQVVSLDAFRKK